MRVVVTALALVASACTWSQFGAGPGHLSTSPDSGITPANASSVSLLWRATNFFDGEPAVTPEFVYAVSPGFLYAYKTDAAGCTGTPRVCTTAWFAHFAGGAATSPIVDGDRVFVAWNAGSQWALAAYDAHGAGDCSGPPGCRPRWTATWGSAPNPGGSRIPMVVSGGRIYVLTEGTTLGAPATITGFDEAGAAGCGGTPVQCQPLFRTTNTLAPYVWPTVAAGHVFADSFDHSAVLAFDAAGQAGCTAGTCSLQFRLSTGMSTTVSVSGDTAFAGVGQQLRAYDATGASRCSGVPKVCLPKWSAALGDTASPDPPAVAGGRVFIGVNGNTGWIRAFDANGVTACSGSPTTCAPLWGTTPLPGSTVHVSTAKSVLVASWWNVNPNFTSEVGVEIFDLAGQTGCTGTPPTCSSLAHVTLGSHPGISNPALAAGRIVVLTPGNGSSVQVLGVPS